MITPVCRTLQRQKTLCFPWSCAVRTGFCFGAREPRVHRIQCFHLFPCVSTQRGDISGARFPRFALPNAGSERISRGARNRDALQVFSAYRFVQTQKPRPECPTAVFAGISIGLPSPGTHLFGPEVYSAADITQMISAPFTMSKGPSRIRARPSTRSP